MSPLSKAIAAWGESLPDWVRALAEACDESSLRKMAATLGTSPAMLSLAINKQRENLDFIKSRVEARLMIATVPCPVLGVMARRECLREQARPFSCANPLRVQLYRACRNGCSYYKGKEIT